MSRKIKPPKWANRLFLWFSNRANSEDLQGDLEEIFHAEVPLKGLIRARMLYWWRTFSLMFSYALKLRKQAASLPSFSSTKLSAGMFTNYLKTATRNLARNKFFTILNVVGLALGLSISLLFVAMLSFIYRYDNFHSQGERIYRITTRVDDRNENPHYASAPAALVSKLKTEFPGVDIVVPIQQSLHGEATYGEKKIYLEGCFTTPDFWNLFNFPLIKGSPLTALSQPNSIVLTEREAHKIFGDHEAMGETINFPPFGNFIVTGILQDMPKNTHIRFDVLASYSTWEINQSNHVSGEASWTDFMDSYIYLTLPDQSSFVMAKEYLAGVSTEKYTQGDIQVEFKMQALADIIPGPSLKNPIGISWDYLSIMLIGSITVIILIPACSNYISLAISQSLNRMREIGVRKTMGGQKSQIFFQFIMETTLTMLLALILSYFIFELIRGEYLTNFGDNDTMDLTPTFTMVINFILFALLVGFIAGIIPALYFARLTTVKALKGKTEQTDSNGLSMRNVMMTLQFMLSLGFIMSVVIMYRQYQYSVNYDIGFQQKNILNVELLNVKPDQFRAEFEKLSSVGYVSMSSHLLGLGGAFTRYILPDDSTDSIEVKAISADENYLINMELTLLSGSSFSDQPSRNAGRILVNEEFVKLLELESAANAVDKLVRFADGRELRIAGVMKNFHYEGLKSQVGPFFMEYEPANFRYANLSLASGSHFRDIADMELTWKKLGSDEKFIGKFLADEIEEAYSFYYLMIKLWGYLGLMAITVACLGLLGTVVFTIRNRLKEVSIRKVMGASSSGLIFLLSRQFVIVMVIAGVITVPAVYLMFQNWLLPSVQYYSVQLGFMEAAISLFIMLILGLTTILSQTLKAAHANPVDSLRSE